MPDTLALRHHRARGQRRRGTPTAAIFYDFGSLTTRSGARRTREKPVGESEQIGEHVA